MSFVSEQVSDEPFTSPIAYRTIDVERFRHLIQTKQLICILINDKNKDNQRVGGFCVEVHSCKIKLDSEVNTSRTLRSIFLCPSVLESKRRIHLRIKTPCPISLHSLSWNLILLHEAPVKTFDNNIITNRVICSVILAVYDWIENLG